MSILRHLVVYLQMSSNDKRLQFPDATFCLPRSPTAPVVTVTWAPGCTPEVSAYAQQNNMC